MSELVFRTIEITDKSWIDAALKRSQFRGCEYTFGNNFTWRRAYNVEIAPYEEMYLLRWDLGGEGVKYSFPAGGCGVREAVELLKGYCDQRGEALVISANKEMTELILVEYPEARAHYRRDSSDYIYLADDLSELRGKKYHAKRNHLNRFYENDWSFEPITSENIPECLAMNERWCEENIVQCDVKDSIEQQSKLDESCVVRCGFKYYEALGYTGGLIRVNGEVQAFTFGEPSADDTFVVHVEKALKTYQGAYTAINREFVRSLGGRYRYINREEDTGAENLRKAKLSYNPVFLEDKFDITFGGK